MRTCVALQEKEKEKKKKFFLFFHSLSCFMTHNIFDGNLSLHKSVFRANNCFDALSPFPFIT